MFTPPPSPLPPIRHGSPNKLYTNPSGVVQTRCRPIQDTHRPPPRQRSHFSIRWTIILVPLVLILLAAYTRFWVHPAAFDLFSTDNGHEWTEWANAADWSLHEPHEATRDRLVRRSTSSSLAALSTATPTPTVPVNPTLPTPFPQPFDTTLSANFSTTECYDFFLNMTQEDAFRACRPMSLLITTSSAFEETQGNISLMNADVWGTCNTDYPQTQCSANMFSFASLLESSCQQDITDQVATAVNTLNALHAYDLMRNATCKVDSVTHSYCFIEAVASPDPSSYWFYQLPLGQPIAPKITTSACSKCTSELMAMYSLALNHSDESTLIGLAQTYNAAAGTLNSVCGPSYAKNAQTSTSTSSAWANAGLPTGNSLMMLGVLIWFAAVLCGS